MRISNQVLLSSPILLAMLGCLGGAAKAVVISPSSGKQLCSALIPEDFNKAGVPVTSLHEANLDSPASAYCMYESKAGKVEFDIFYPAGDTPADVKATEKTVLAEVGGKFEPIPLAGTDSATINLAVPGRQPSASIAVRSHNALITLNIPAGPNARQQLVVLAETALARLEH